METAHPPKEDVVRRGKELYEQHIRAKVEAGNKGKMLIIDIETGEFEMDDNELTAIRRARAKHHDAVLYGMRIGFPTAHKIGGGWGAAKR